MKAELFDALCRLRAQGRAAAVLTDLATGAQRLVAEGTELGELALSPAALHEARALLAADRNGMVELAGQRLFLRSYSPPRRLVIVGAVHIAQALAPMAQLAGFEVTVVDPRGAFATAERFPGITLACQWADEYLAEHPLDGSTAVVALTHDPKLDDPMIEAALRAPVFYIGALGSRKTHARRVERLAGRGFGAAEMARIHAPIGLDLGGRATGEIAVAVLAQVVRVRNRPDAAS